MRTGKFKDKLFQFTSNCNNTRVSIRKMQQSFSTERETLSRTNRMFSTQPNSLSAI